MSRLGHFGRFGNQVFQYAFGRLYAARHGLRYQAPQWAGSELFGHNDPPITDLGLQMLFEPENNSILTRLPQPVVNVDLLGYFQYHTSYYAPQQAAFRDLYRPPPRWRAPLDDAIARACVTGTGHLSLCTCVAAIVVRAGSLLPRLTGIGGGSPRIGQVGTGRYFISPATHLTKSFVILLSITQ